MKMLFRQLTKEVGDAILPLRQNGRDGFLRRAPMDHTGRRHRILFVNAAKGEFTATVGALYEPVNKIQTCG
jgi:hypothetical protein